MSKHNGKPNSRPKPRTPARLGQMIAIAKIVPNPLNPRKTFHKDELNDLAVSIAAIGVEVPLIVRPAKRAGCYELVDGERRYRAAKIAEITEAPCIVREMTDAQVLQAMLVADMQRAGIDDLERAGGIYKLHTDHGASLEDIASWIGRSVSTVRHLLRLRDLPKIVRQACKEGELPTSTALAIARVPGTETREKLARLVLSGSRYWQGKPPTDADVAHRRKNLDVEPLTYRQTRELIAENCYRQLKQAPFSRQSLDLITDAGSCDACPKRVGNLKDDPEYANVREDVCIDPECYEAKVKAHAARMLADCQESGRPVLAGNDAERLFSQWNPTQLVSNDWIDLGDHCPEDRKNRPYEKLLGKTLADQITMAVDPAGTIHRLVPVPEARKALKDLGIKIETGGGNSWSAEQAKQRAEDLIKKEAARRCMGLVAAKAEAMAAGGEPIVEMMRQIVDGVIDRTWDDVNRQVKIRRQLQPKKKERATSGGNRNVVAELVPSLEVPGLIGLLAELVAGQKALGYGAMSADAKRYWDFFGVDTAAVLKQVRDEKSGKAKPELPTSDCCEPWCIVVLADMGLSRKTEKLMRKKKLLSAGEVADFVARTTPANGKPSRLRDEILKAIEILRSQHQPDAVERAAQRQQEEDEFDFAGKEAAHA